MAKPPQSRGGFTAAIDRVAPGLELVERAMREQLGSESALVGHLGGHVLGAGGKRIRPALLPHAAVGALPELRRARPSANAVWGNRRAILAGDFMYARASAMIVEDGDLDILWIFAATIRQMAEGELV